jgi:hypothetical protein
MSYTLKNHPQNPDEYVTDAPHDYVHGLMRAASEKRPHELHGVGADMGNLALFGRAREYGSDGKPTSYGMESIARLPFPGSSSERRTVPRGSTDGYHKWDIHDLDPRELTGTQHGLQGGAMSHYLKHSYGENAKLFDNSQGSGNDRPVVVGFMKRKFIMSGHHRAAAALLKGEPLQARYKEMS